MYTLPRIDFCESCRGFLPVSRKGSERLFYCSSCEPVEKTAQTPETKTPKIRKPKTPKPPGIIKRKSRAKALKTKKLFTPVQEKIMEVMTSGDILTLSEIQERVTHYSPFYVHNNLKILVRSETIKRKMVGVSRPFPVYCIKEINLEEYSRNSCEKMLERIFKDPKVFTFEELYSILCEEFSEKVIRNNICYLQRKGKIFTRRVNDPDNISIYSSSKENLQIDKRLLLKEKIYNFLIEKDFATNKEIRTVMGVNECTIRSHIKQNSNMFSKWMTPGKKTVYFYSIKEKDENILKSHPELIKIK